MANLLWEQGNLYTGYPYGVQVEKQFGSTELYGPFSSENEAWNFGMSLARQSNGTESFTIVKLETPHHKTIATSEEIRKHRESA
jgi:hypothetical protein